jgi:hypothetical protein
MAFHDRLQCPRNVKTTTPVVFILQVATIDASRARFCAPTLWPGDKAFFRKRSSGHLFSGA